jgi:Tfp pilus assembly protein PilN
VPAKFAKRVNAEGNLAAWATVLGLATYKHDIFDYNNQAMAIERTNLMPGHDSQIKTLRTQILSTLIMAAVFVAVMTISGASLTILSTQSYSLAGKIKTLEPAKGQYDVKNQELQKLQMVMGKIKSLDNIRVTLPSNQMQILTIYKNIAKSIPDGVWLSDVNFGMPKGKDAKGNYTAEISGNSINDQNILEFVKRLNEAGGFKNLALKKMEALENKDKAAVATVSRVGQVKKFILEGELEGNAGIKKLEIISSGAK